MSAERQEELIAYASVCFEHCTNPFDRTHLIKKKVSADECRDLSHFIADILNDCVTEDSLKKAEEDFKETQA